MRGLLVNVYRNAEHGDCTNGGVTSRHTSLVLTGEGIPQIFEPTEEHPEVRLCVEDLGFGKRVCARPVLSDGRVLGVDVDGCGPWMDGGNFVYTCDSRFPRFSDTGMHFPIPVHDRQETWKEHERMSI